MRWIRNWLAILSFLGALAISGHCRAQPDALVENGPSQPPDLGIQDDGGFFSRNATAKQRISDQLGKLEAAHGFRIVLMVEPVLIGTTAPELAARLQQSWLPDGNGLVVVFESDSRSIGFGRDVGGEPTAEDRTGRVPTHETAAILERVRATTDPKLAPEAYIEALLGNLVSEFDSYFKLRMKPPPPERSLRMGLLTIGGLTLLALAAIGIGALVRLPSMSGARSFRFPVVDRPERLGAPGGGGNVTVRRFRTK